MIAYILPILLIVGTAMAAPSEQTDLSRGLSQFSLELYHETTSANKDKNIILSPYSVAVALALAAQGAKGSTLDQLIQGLHLSGDKRSIAQQFSVVTENLSKNLGNSTLNVANKVFVQEKYSVKKEFNDVAVKSFRSESQSLDFAKNVDSANTINQWVEDKTKNKIKNLIPADALSGDTRMVLVNAIYFKGNWEHRFDKTRTAPAPFWTSESNSVDVDYMHVKEHFNYGQIQDLDATAIDLKYEGSDISFLVILPNKRTGLSALEQSLRNYDLSSLTKNMYNQEVDVTLPKFKIEFGIELNDVLEKMGMGQMFNADADFSDLLEQTEPLQVSKVIHKAFIDVNEEGAEAAAATGIVFFGRSGRVQRVTQFKADHPFYYSIIQRESDTPTVVFSGRYIKNE